MMELATDQEGKWAAFLISLFLDLPVPRTVLGMLQGKVLEWLCS